MEQAVASIDGDKAAMAYRASPRPAVRATTRVFLDFAVGIAAILAPDGRPAHLVIGRGGWVHAVNRLALAADKAVSRGLPCPLR
jgi:hypothetical protein